MNRRALLRLVGGSALGWGGWSKAARADSHPWSYDTVTGPDLWGDLEARFRLCRTGQQQSPVNLNHSAKAAGGVLDSGAIAYRPAPLTAAQDTGLTLQVDLPVGSQLYLDDEAFTLRQFHFHTPSEHTVADAAFPMELHLVHQSAAGTIVVLGVFLVEGQENPSLASIWTALASGDRSGEVAIDALLPGDRRTVRYQGSLTTPPCSEGVRWVLFQTPVEVSRKQLDAFRSRFAPNARPIQRQMSW